MLRSSVNAYRYHAPIIVKPKAGRQTYQPAAPVYLGLQSLSAGSEIGVLWTP